MRGITESEETRKEERKQSARESFAKEEKMKINIENEIKR